MSSDCFQPIMEPCKLSPFELAVQEELPEVWTWMQDMIQEATMPTKFFVGIARIEQVLAVISKVYDLRGREGLREMHERGLAKELITLNLVVEKEAEAIVENITGKS